MVLPGDENNDLPYWVVAQLGAREHYTAARTLHRSRHLKALITDAWIKPQSTPRLPFDIAQKLSGRWSDDLADAPVHAFNLPLYAFELRQTMLRRSGWRRIIARNAWFQKKCASTIQSLAESRNQHDNPGILYAYSYAALDILKAAKQHGWRTILGQIDPGLVEERLVADEHAARPEFAGGWSCAPGQYWDNWREECALSDRIIVNSRWSEKALVKIGIEPEKIIMVPLVYEPMADNNGFDREYPARFDNKRPLRLLFLGQVILRKGIAALLEAADRLTGSPVRFRIVGRIAVNIPDRYRNLDNIEWIGQVPRSRTGTHYRWADAFLFPTLSDGFGLTQLEAQAWQLPLICSRNCGDVVQHEKNGLLLDSVKADAIVNAIEALLHKPLFLQEYAAQSTQTGARFTLSDLNQRLNEIAHAIF